MELTINWIVNIIGIYLALGFLFSIVFMWKGLHKVDEGVNGSGFFFKVLIFPGMIVFWVLFLKKWIQTK